MLLRALLIVLGLVATAEPCLALAPPPPGARFPEPVRLASRAGLFAPAADPGGAPLLGGRRAAPRSARGEVQHARVPVLPVDFTDQAAHYSPDTLHTLLFAPRSTGPGTGSAHDYYWDVSVHQYDLQGDVLPWAHAANPKDYYADDRFGLNHLSPLGRNAAGLVLEVLRDLDTLVDLSPYDTDGDGFVDAVWVVHSGQGGEYNTSDPTNLWSHESSLTSWGLSPFTTHAPWPGHPGQFLKVNKYIMVPELSGQHPGQLNEIGSFCHEHGHTLGLPDLYNTSGPPYGGVGNWDLMAGGVYGGDGHHADSPAMLGAWSRAWLGWVPATVVDTEGPARLDPTETTPRTLQLWTNGRPGNEYELLENRQQQGWDRYLPAGGLLVWHVDDQLVSAGIPSNTVETPPYFGVRLTEADGLDQLYQGFDRGDAGDPYPGSTRNATLDAWSQPALLDRNGFNPNVAVHGIRVNGDGSVGAYLTFSPTGWLAPRTLPAPSGNLHLTAPPGRSLAADAQGTLHLAWAVSEATASHVFYASSPLGLRWDSSGVQLDQAVKAFSPSLAVDSRGTLMAVWEQLDGASTQLAARRRPAGGAWEAPVVLRQGTSITSSPALAVDPSGNFCCVWAERPAGSSLERIATLVYRNPGGWDAGPTAVPDDSGGSNPALTVDGRGHMHLAYEREADERLRLYASARDDVTLPWSTPTGPLTGPLTTQVPMLAPLDSGRVALAWGEPRTGGQDYFYRIFNGVGWDPPGSAALNAVQTAYPPTLLADTSAGTLLFFWEDDQAFGARVEYRQVSFLDPWDSSPHVLAGSDSAPAGEPGAVWDAAGNLLSVWTQGGAIHLRMRQAVTRRGAPPAIVFVTAQESHLGRSHPNPMSPRTAIPFDVPVERATAIAPPGPARPGAPLPPPAEASARRVRLSIHDVAGRRVRLLLDAPRDPGHYEIQWDGTLEGGAQAPSGLYFYRLDLGRGHVETRKLLVVR